jgi:accessory gene regulator B
MVLLLYAPVISRNRPNYDLEQKKRFKMLSIAVTTFYFALFMIFNNWDFSQIIMWGILLNSLQLLLGKEVEFYYEKQII